MRCPSCDRENREDASFCDACGGRLARACPSCGRDSRPSSSFCDSCGQRLNEPAPTRTPTPTPAPAIPSSFASGRYQVQRFLGEGGKKRVYLARDPRLDRDVAVAFVKTEGLDESGIARVRREAQAMGRLGSHPHIVTVHDTGDESGQPYIVQEFMDGGSLEELLEQAEDHRLVLERSLGIAGEICQGLQHAHGHGVIHRDLKPGNVWLTGEGTAKLGDFGLAVAINQSRLTQEGMMIGTSLYMPPEQAVGGEATERSDLYSFGCMLYEMVAGRPPFLGDDPTSVISQHINTAPVAPSWYTEHCPPDLEELILKLLAKAPDDRPESAAEVIEALARVDPAERSASHTESNVLDRLARGVFVGREQELERLRKAFDAAFAGRGGVVMLVGEPGIGKTRTAQELETYARVRGAQVLWGTAHESAGAPAYWPWVQVGRSNVWADNLAELQADMQGAEAEMTRIFPELKQNPAIGEPEPVADPEAAQFRLFDAYTTFVRAMAARTPLLIALDDLHWSDKPSLLLLQHIARELSRMRVLIVGTYRDTELVRTHPLSETLAALNRESGFQRVVLRGLSRDEVAGYIRAAANVSPNHDVLDRIYEETEGNPFFLSEVVNLLTQEGALTRDSVSDIAVPDGVREALGRRLDRISEETNELLQVAAVAGREFAYETLTLLGDRREEELLRLIEEALEARVIEEMEQPGRYRFMHALMQETLLGELSTTRRVRLHGQVGDALERRWGDRAGERAPRLARHFVEAAMLTQGHAEKAVRYSKLAAQQAEEQSGWAEAANHYEACLTLVNGAEDGLDEDEAALLVAHGICARNAGEYRASWRSLMRAITLYREREDPCGAASATLESLLIDAPPARQLAQIRDALAILGDADPYLEARLLSHLIYPRVSGRMSEEELSNAREKAAALVDAHGFDDVHAQILSADGYRFAENGEYEKAADLAWQSHQRFARLGRVRQAAWILFIQAADVVFLGRLDDALSAAEQGLAYAREYHQLWSEENCVALIAMIRFLRCEYEQFDEMAEERASDAGYIIHVVRAARAEQTGDLTRAVRYLPEPGVAGGDPMYLGQIHAARARVLLNAGGRREAEREFGLMREALNANQVAREFDGVLMHVSVLGALDESILVLADDTFLAAAESRMRELPGKGFYDLMGKGSERVLAAILLHRGKIDAAEQRFRAGLEWAERERCPVEEGRCLQGLAEVAERSGDTAEAMRLLDQAAALFQRHEAKLYLDRVIATKVKIQGISSGDIRTSINAVAAIVESERPDLRPHASPDGTVTLLFTDIEGSTPMTERLGDQRWMELLREHNGLVREQVREHDGYEVKTEGDGFMLAFSSARKALQCAITIQRAFAEHNETAEEPLRVRIGLHTGEAVRDAGDFYGRHVVLASRIADEAKGGEILVSSLLKELTESAGDIAFGEGREVELKGLTGRQHVHEVAWE